MKRNTILANAARAGLTAINLSLAMNQIEGATGNLSGQM